MQQRARASLIGARVVGFSARAQPRRLLFCLCPLFTHHLIKLTLSALSVRSIPMRLINVESSKIETFSFGSIPPYAILSHTWGVEEVSFEEYTNEAYQNEQIQLYTGYWKIDALCSQAHADGLEYAWIDTCCIDKSSSLELSEAINSMYRWYQRAHICYAYLADTSAASPGLEGGVADQEAELAKARWFTRGWTLQELIAPRQVQFYDKDWRYLGNRTSLQGALARITGIDESILAGTASVQSVSVATRMTWAAGRNTTRVEDLAYSLLGLFDLNMPLLYGEGVGAFDRLQEEVLRNSDNDSLLTWQPTYASDATRTHETDNYLRSKRTYMFAESPRQLLNLMYRSQQQPSEEEFSVSNSWKHPNDTKELPLREPKTAEPDMDPTQINSRDTLDSVSADYGLTREQWETAEDVTLVGTDANLDYEERNIAGTTRIGSSLHEEDIKASAGTEIGTEAFDLRSLTSNDEDIASQVHRRRTEPELLAVKLFGAFFAKYDGLRALHEELLGKLGTARFVHNYRRSLKIYVLELKKSARTPLEKDVIKVLEDRSNRQNMAIQVVEYISPEEADSRRGFSGWAEETLRKQILEEWMGNTYGAPDPAPAVRDDWDEGGTSESDEEDENAGLRDLDELKTTNIDIAQQFLEKGVPLRAMISQLHFLSLPFWLREIMDTTPPHAIEVFDEGYDSSRSIVNTCKAWIEESSMSTWDWWPLQPRVPRFPSEISLLKWEVSDVHAKLVVY